MGRTVTVSVRGLLTTAVVLLALLSVYLLGAAGGGGSPARAATGTAEPAARARLLTMGGTGEATAVPDQLGFDLRVTLLRADLETALQDASARTQRVLDTLGRLGVRHSDVQTTGLSMYPVYDYHSYAPPTLRGYRVTQRASVLVRDLGSGGRVVSAAVATGGDAVRVSDLRLKVGDADAVLARARAAAVAEARTKAEQYAAAAGLDLGDVVTLHENGAPTPPRANLERGYRLQAGTLDHRSAADLPLPIRAGRHASKVSVQVVWELR